MVSKWYLEMPEDFEEDYTALVCPVGKRCCVMAIDVSTQIYFALFVRITNKYKSSLQFLFSVYIFREKSYLECWPNRIHVCDKKKAAK